MGINLSNQFLASMHRSGWTQLLEGIADDLDKTFWLSRESQKAPADLRTAFNDLVCAAWKARNVSRHLDENQPHPMTTEELNALPEPVIGEVQDRPYSLTAKCFDCGGEIPHPDEGVFVNLRPGDETRVMVHRDRTKCAGAPRV